jgi:hypothetical protein
MATRAPKPVWFGMKVTPEQKQRIQRLARRQQTTAKEAVLRLVDQALAQEADEEIPVAPGSFIDGLEKLVGSVSGPEDLSTHPRHMDGFGR